MEKEFVVGRKYGIPEVRTALTSRYLMEKEFVVGRKYGIPEVRRPVKRSL